MIGDREPITAGTRTHGELAITTEGSPNATRHRSAARAYSSEKPIRVTVVRMAHVARQARRASARRQTKNSTYAVVRTRQNHPGTETVAASWCAVRPVALHTGAAAPDALERAVSPTVTPGVGRGLAFGRGTMLASGSIRLTIRLKAQRRCLAADDRTG